MKDLNTNQKIAIAAIVAAVLVAGFFWYTSPYNSCVRTLEGIGHERLHAVLTCKANPS